MENLELDRHVNQAKHFRSLGLGPSYAIFERYYEVFRDRTPFFRRPSDTVSAAVQIGFRAHFWSCFSGLYDIGRSGSVPFLLRSCNRNNLLGD